MKKVSYIFPTLHHYRAPFHEMLRIILAESEVDYSVVYSDPGPSNIIKADTVELKWGKKVRATSVLGLVYQHGFREALESDLVIIQQENRLILNYFLIAASLIGKMRVAYFGHGRNFQARNYNSISERIKRFLTTKVNWWFAYTEETRRHVLSLGFDDKRITVFNNSVDTTCIGIEANAVDADTYSKLENELGIFGEKMAIFVGGLYSDKRIEFLVSAADSVRKRIQDFQLVVVGGGEEFARLQQLAADRPWLILAGPRFGREKVALMLRAKLFLMPGLVGLAILDAGALGLPVVTTSYPFHSPEIAYLRNDESGIIVDGWQDVDCYADEVVSVLLDESRRARLAEGARAMARRYTVEAMAERFAAGVLKALADGRRRV